MTFAGPRMVEPFFNFTPGSIAVEPPAAVFEFHRRLPHYRPTPLVSLPAAAVQLGVRRVWVKDESDRLGLPAYKVLGATWAIYRALEHRLGPFQPWTAVDDLRRQLAAGPRVGLVAATEGNHGRAVARMARWLGLSAHILMPETALAERRTAISLEGAQLSLVRGTYDDAVKAAAALDGPDWLTISDTAWPGYEQIPRWVVEGYDTLFCEIDAQLAASGEPSPAGFAVQMGVGALASSVVRHYRRPGSPTAVMGVEPAAAACVLASLHAGKICEIPGPFDPLMGGLNCGVPSGTAWPILAKGLSASLAVSTPAAMRAATVLDTAGVSASPSAAAGLAGLVELLGGPFAGKCRREFGWNHESSLVVISTEHAVTVSP